MTDRQAEKARYRRLGQAARRRIAADRRRAAAQAVAGWAPDLKRLAQRGAVSCFSTYGSELDTAPLIAALARCGCPVALPIVTGRGKPLTFRRWRPGDSTRAGAFGIREPLETAPLVRPSVLLVPLLCFDRRGFRVGYGGGFYDRTIAAVRAERRIAAVGLAFADQAVGRVPVGRYDLPVDSVLTERGLVICSGGARAAALRW